MKIEKQYKLDVENEMKSNSTFEDIKDRVNVKEEKKSFNYKPLLAFAGCAGVLVIAVSVLTNLNSTKTGALAYQLSPTMNKEIAKAPVSNNALSAFRGQLLAPNKLDKEDKENAEDMENIMYEVDALISNKNTYKIKDIESDREDYAKAQKVSFVLLNGEESSYTLYYNEIDESSNEKKNKSSYEMSFSGVAVAEENVDMPFTFESKEETKKNKSSYSAVTTIDLNKSRRVVITSESEEKKNKDQESYKYEYFVNGALEDTYTISYNAKKSKTSCTVETPTSKYTVEKKVTNKKEMFSIHSSDENGNRNVTYKKVIESNGTVDYEEEQAE